MSFNAGQTVNTTVLQRALIEGNAYRISKRLQRDDGEELIIHIDPTVSGETVYIEAPSIGNEDRIFYDVYENADPGNNLIDDLEVHGMRYDGQEQPDTLVQRVSSGGLDTTNADKTEETFVTTGTPDVSTGSASARAIYRIIPETDVISLIARDDSGGTSNTVSMDLVLYEGETLPE